MTAHPEPIGIEELLSRLDRVRPAGDQKWIARCPAHEDKGPSLSVAKGEKGIVLYCFAGCDLSAIIAALGIQAAQLFPSRDPNWRPSREPYDPDRRVKELLVRLSHLHDMPAPTGLTEDLATVGRLILKRQTAVDVPSLSAWPLRLIALAIQELAKQATPRRWYHPRALERIIDESPTAFKGYARSQGLYPWCRRAITAEMEIL